MKARAALSAVVSIVLALAPGAQAAVVEGRISIGELGGVRALPLTVGSLTSVPTLSGSLFAAPSLGALSLAAAPTLNAVVPIPTRTIDARAFAIARPAAALTARVIPAATKSERPNAPPERARQIGQRFDELRNAFDEKTPLEAPLEPGGPHRDHAQLHPNALEHAVQSHDPPQPPQPPRSGLFGFSRPLAFFLLAMIISQVGIEAQTASLPPLIAKVFGNVSVAADVGMTAALSELVGTIASPIAAKYLGLKSAYLWSSGLRVATGGLIAGLLATGFLGIGGLLALMAVDGLLLGLSLTMEKSIPAVMVKQDHSKLEHFKAARQTAVEAVATIVPIITGTVIASFGFIPALVAFPLAMTISITTVAITLKLPGKISGLSGEGLPGPGEGTLRSYVEHLMKGAKEVVTTPTLLFSVLAYALVYAPIILVYWVIGPAYSLHLAGAGHETLAAAYGGMINGLYSLGGIIAGVFVMRQQRTVRNAAEMRSSMLKWTAACAIGMLLFGSLAIPVGALWATVTLPALALLFFGVPQVTARLKLESYYQSRAPAGSIADATAVLESASSIFIIVSLWIVSKLLAGAGIVSLLHLSLALGPMIAALLLVTWALARASRRNSYNSKS